jgi:hypothetical protein
MRNGGTVGPDRTMSLNPAPMLLNGKQQREQSP